MDAVPYLTASSHMSLISSGVEVCSNRVWSQADSISSILILITFLYSLNL